MKRLLIIGATAAVVLGNYSTANAGFGEFLDNWFTYREDQKELIRPKSSNMQPIVVQAPNYNEKEARAWTEYYRRGDLVPVEGFDNATMVMRPNTTAEYPVTTQYRIARAAATPEEVLRQRAGYPIGKTPEDYRALQWRDHANRMQAGTGDAIMIGEPGEGVNYPIKPGQEVGKKAVIGDPKFSWRDKPITIGNVTPRPGDFNYQEPIDSIEQGYEGGVELTDESGKVSSYTVKRGDTLTGISNQGQVYGDWKLWPLIYDANRTQIKDPDLIYPQQQFGIPREYSQKTEMRARERALLKRPPHVYNDGM